MSKKYDIRDTSGNKVVSIEESSNPVITALVTMFFGVGIIFLLIVSIVSLFAAIPNTFTKSLQLWRGGYQKMVFTSLAICALLSISLVFWTSIFIRQYNLNPAITTLMPYLILLLAPCVMMYGNRHYEIKHMEDVKDWTDVFVGVIPAILSIATFIASLIGYFLMIPLLMKP